MEYNRFFPVNKLQKTDPILMQSGSVFDTILEMERIVKTTLEDTAAIALELRGATLEATCRNIFDFVYGHIQYTLDKDGVEQLRRPARAWSDRKRGVDCDCYSIFISSILTNLGIGHYLRMTKYNGKPDFQHIYIVVPKKNGTDLTNKASYYTIDCVLDNFNQEVPFSGKHDKKMMPIQYLNGVESPIKKPGFGAEFIGLGKVSGLGATLSLPEIGHELLNRTKLHLENTRDILKPNPAIMEGGATYLSQIEFVLNNWDNPVARAQALEKVSQQELNGLNGWSLKGAFDAVKDAVKQAAQWIGDKVSDATQAVKTGVNNALDWAGDKVKKAGDLFEEIGKGIIKYNPLSIAIRNGLLLAFKINLFRMAERLGYGYWDDATAQAKGMNMTEFRKLKNALDFVKTIHSGLQGDMDILKKNILQGWDQGTKKHNLLRGLGSVEASIAAATPVIIKILAELAAVAIPMLLAKALAPGEKAPDYSQDNAIPPGFDFKALDEELKKTGGDPPPTTEGNSSIILFCGIGLLGAALLSKNNGEKENDQKA
jgi:hypothetical protein